jgi:hypothetical protein
VLPLAFSVLVTLLVLGPVVFAFGILAGQAQAWLTDISMLDKGGLVAPSLAVRISAVSDDVTAEVSQIPGFRRYCYRCCSRLEK